MRRVSTSLAIVCLLTAGLAACGSDTDAGDEGSVKVTGAFGELPEVTYESPYVVTSTEVDVLTEGDGDVIESGDAAFVNIYIGNGFTGKQALSTWVIPGAAEYPIDEPSDEATDESESKKDNKKNKKDSGDTESVAAAEDDEVVATPELIAFTSGASIKALEQAVIGHAVGSRVLVSAPGADAYGYAGSDLGLGNEDTTVFLVDIVAKVRPSVDTSAAVAPDGLPTVVEEGGKVTALDFTDAAKKAGNKLRVETLVEGDGPAIEKNSLVALRYLGHIWGKKKSFDSNWDAELPVIGSTPLTVGIGAVIEGWDEGLIGVKEGSRVLIVIPSDKAYGKDGKGDDIPPNSDLVFVIDVLGVV